MIETDKNDDEDAAEEDEESDEEFSARPSRFAALENDGNSSPMIESDTSTEEDGKATLEKQPAKKHKKRRRKKDKKAVADESNTKLDELLRELERKDLKTNNKRRERLKSTPKEPQIQPNSSSSIDLLLNIDPSKLQDVEELQTVVNRSVPQPRGRPPLPLGKIVQSRVNWPQPRHLGFQMILESVDEAEGMKWYRYWHKEAYQRQQQQFWRLQWQMDFQGILTQILQFQNPYHLDSLLALADQFEKQGDSARAQDMVERGIFACEFAEHPTYQTLSSAHRMDYACRENRVFFLLLHRQLLAKSKQNRWRPALEFAKLIFAKDPDGDPLAILLQIDTLAIRARCPNFLLDFNEHFGKSKRLDLLPNFCFSLPLALRMLGQEEEAEKFLEEAFVPKSWTICKFVRTEQLNGITT